MAGEDLIEAGIFSFMLMFIWFFVLILIAVYIYFGFAFMAIGRKAKLKSPELAWIPGFGPLIIAYQASKMHWWPWLLLLSSFVSSILLFFLMISSEIILIIITLVIFIIISFLVFSVFTIIWEWKMFEVIKKPGWFALFRLGGFIPYVGFIFSIAQLVLYGIAAWSKD